MTEEQRKAIQAAIAALNAVIEASGHEAAAFAADELHGSDLHRAITVGLTDWHDE